MEFQEPERPEVGQRWGESGSADAPPSLVRFDDFEVDLASRRLLRGGRRVRLQEKPFQLLEALLRRPGETLSRDELGRLLWTSSPHLELDASLNVAARKLRLALEDSAAEPRWLFTVTGEGYRFEAAVEEVPGPRPRRGRWVGLGVGITLVGALALLASLPWGPTTSGSPVTPPIRLAIMPFELAGEARSADLARVSEWLVADLSTLHPRLEIIGPRFTAPFSQFPFPDPRRLEEELEADFVLNARVIEEGGESTLIVELIDLGDASHPWARLYSDPWRWEALAKEIAGEVEGALGVEPGGPGPRD